MSENKNSFDVTYPTFDFAVFVTSAAAVTAAQLSTMLCWGAEIPTHFNGCAKKIHARLQEHHAVSFCGRARAQGRSARRAGARARKISNFARARAGRA